MVRLGVIKCEVMLVLLSLYGFSVVDLVLVVFGLIFIIISGKVRRGVCVE